MRLQTGASALQACVTASALQRVRSVPYATRAQQGDFRQGQETVRLLRIRHGIRAALPSACHRPEHARYELPVREHAGIGEASADQFLYGI
jgi:hypothetical protein